MPRIRNVRTKTEVVRVRATADDVQRWREAAETDQRPLSDWIRRRCNNRPTTKARPRSK